ncbi:MAG: DUF1365 domain-containing protein [Bacteriovoracaceae bacterium]
MIQSSLMIGDLQHSRFLPKSHTFRYGLVLFYLDLDEVNSFFKIPKLFGFHREDYLKGASLKSESLKDTVRRLIKEKTGKECDGPIRIVTQLRYFGFCFNPVSFYYCFDTDQKYVQFLVAEITNTPWNERKVYVLECQNESKAEQFEMPKNFHVSPFMPMELLWKWRFQKPSALLNQCTVSVHMEDWTIGEKKEKYFSATLNLQPKTLNRSNLFKVLMLFPLLTLKPFLSIYYQAFILKLKNIPFHSHPDQEKRL